MEDFCYMRQGKQIASLQPQDLESLKTVAVYKPQKNRALLLLHGFSSSPAVYRLLIPKIHHYDAIVCPALAGHAQSLEAFSLSKASDWLATASEACEQLIREYSCVHVLGLSLGGLLACELSKHYPINHLFLLAPALRLQMNLQYTLKLARLLKSLGFTHVRNKAGNLCSTTQAEITYKKLPITTAIEMLSLAMDYKWSPPTCPVDLFLGKKDNVVASEEVARLFENRPQATIHTLNHSAHVLPLDNDFEEIIQSINAVSSKAPCH